ncbi:soluble starch synthase 1, chloroplastic/amyloplastic-like isoform X2 [Selaginella moellendorffii]|uniref:soluble starch synthase 1, chloroplastic/amyloplastic-like isoform X2 n=1 Tax=Selaginella moellendorffii TaxID=88036 RepID=UPI000D1CDDF5|nr:soluble starch synthase 1, chloroplastic/amyloplastic-like isoform X2 [Selaginella moellendorffii]|eukprot:XP_024535180.1 soluble starch synthase 1, chloroplastic/amyloplastic-like isoform X2 [Selaginella moellendorffii]
MALWNWSTLESLLASSSGFASSCSTVTNGKVADSSVSFVTHQPAFGSIRSRKERKKSQRAHSSPNWRSKRIFSFGTNDTILQNDLLSGDIPDLKMLLQSKQVLQKEDLPPITIIDPSTTATVSDLVPPSSEGTKDDKGHQIQAGTRKSKQQARKTYNIVFVAAEVAPYSKVGGLSDVCGSLPVVLAARGHRVMVVSPRYMNGVTDHRYSGAYDAQCRIRIGCFSGQHEVAFFHEYKDGVDWVFVDHCCYHRPGNPYGDGRGAFGDNQFRYTLLCYAACEAPLVLPLGGYIYGDNCIFLANDWHASLVPVLLAAKYRRHGVYLGARSIVVIHNITHQGCEPGTTYAQLGLPPEWYGALEWVFPTWARKHAFDKGEAVNHLKGGLVTADRIVTVSEGYAWEITTSEGGYGLDGLLRSRKIVISGITNGINMAEWDPICDKQIAAHYSFQNLSGKAACKASFQKELGLAVRPDVPLIGFIGRLDFQKGPDLLQAALPALMTDDIQMVMLGSGDAAMESWMRWAESHYRDKFRGWVGFNVPLTHRLIAGCDILVMPSRFEPCGLTQLYAMRYGTIPVVHCTGGLRDTVEDFHPFANNGQGAGTGWTFYPCTKDAMLGVLWTAIGTYRHHKDSWKSIMRRAMSQDYSWDRAAAKYEQLFEWATIDRPYTS